MAERRDVTNLSKARELGAGLGQIIDTHVRILSLQLPAAFELHREEAIKFQTTYADRVDHCPQEPWTTSSSDMATMANARWRG